MEELLKEAFGNSSISIVILTLTMSTVSYLLLKYLNAEKSQKFIIRELENQKANLENSKKAKALEGIIKSAITEEEKQKYLISLFQGEINKKVEEIKSLVNAEKEIENHPEKFRYDQLIENFKTVRNRLFSEIDSLSRRANLNLTIGIISSIIAIGFLFYSGWYSKIDYGEKWFNFVTYFIPKFSLLVFLGTFSFYFLNLYKSNLGVIQNYQNELNNVDFKIISLTSILLSSHQDKEIHLKELISEVSKSDWNKVLKQDETTVELEKLKEFNTFDKDMAFKLWAMNQIFQDSSSNKTTEKE